MYLAVNRPTAAPYVRSHYRRPAGRARVVIQIPRARGVGDFNQQVSTIGSIAASGAATTAALLVQFGAVTGPVGAIIGAAAAGLITVGELIAKQFQGCGQTCVVASQDADQVASYLTQNLNQYFSVPAPRPQSMQAAALNNVDTAFAALQKACSDPALGAAGQRCISERLVRGGTAPWCPNTGHTGCDWFVLFRDPIANDSGVGPDPVPAAAAGGAGSGSGSSAGGSPAAGILQTFGINPNATLNGRPISDLFLPVGLLLAAALFA
jgi:hypothetical protein